MVGENPEQIGDCAMANAQQVGEPPNVSLSHVDSIEPGRVAVAFSLPKAKFSSASRPPVFPAPRDVGKADPGSEFVTEFDGKKRVIGQSATIVIPKLENSWRPEKRMKNIMLETDLQTIAEEDRFEMEAATQEGPQHEYGLTVVKRQTDTLTEDETLGSSAMNSSDNHQSILELEVQRLRQDIEGLPDEASLEAYENIPVEEFGKALLRGMGWETGKPIGRNSKVAVAPLEHARRYGREGLGAVPAPKTEKVKRYIKPGETRSSKPSVGKIMCVKAGKHIGSRGQIVEMKGDTFTLALVKGGERISVKTEELAELGSSDEEKAINKLKELRLERAEDGSKRAGYVDDGNAQDAGSWANGTDMEVHGEKANSHGRSGSHRIYYASVQGRSRRDVVDFQYKDKGHRDKDEGTNDKYESKSNDKSRFMSKDSSEGNERQEKSSDIRSGNEQYKKRDEDRQGRRSRRGDDDHLYSKHDDSRKEKHVNKKLERDDKEAHNVKGKYDVYNREKSNQHRHKGEDRSSVSTNKFERNVDESSSWLVRDIRVRIVDRKLQQGRVYLKKGRIVDVISPLICDVLMDETGELVQDVKQAYLETALPKRGGCIIVVGGKHRGQIGKLQDRDTEKGRGIVQLMDNYEILSLDLDNLAEFTGNADEMEL